MEHPNLLPPVKHPAVHSGTEMPGCLPFHKADHKVDLRRAKVSQAAKKEKNGELLGERNAASRGQSNSAHRRCRRHRLEAPLLAMGEASDYRILSFSEDPLTCRGKVPREPFQKGNLGKAFENCSAAANISPNRSMAWELQSSR